MIKIMLKRRKESDTYVAADRRHRRSTQIAMKVDKVCSFQPALQPSSSADEGRSADWKLHLVIIFHCHLYTPAMSTVSNQVGAALFLSF